jgi:predicted transcriptional regulator
MKDTDMAETTTITVRIPLELKAKLDRLALVTDRSRSFLALEALESYLQYELEIVDGILEGIADADEMEEMSAKLFKDLEQNAPAKTKVA